MTASSLVEHNIPQNKSNRLHFLDGLRGIAILLVVFYHAYSIRWSTHLPYGNAYDDISVVHFGNYGVQLFFIISGFVISMTLEKCKNFWDFMYRRWLRLFPAMLICSIIILLSAPLFTARPYGAPKLMDLLPGVTFIEPEFFRILFGYYQEILEGSFWTLFVEMKFYILAGLLYFTVGAKKMIAVLVAMFFSSIVLEFASPHLTVALADQLKTIYKYLNYQHYGWFAAGALFYQYHRYKNIKYWIMAVLLGLVAARCLGGLPSKSMIVASTIVFLFALSLLSVSLQKILSNKALVFVGFISYPFYLMHEQAMISMITQIHDAYPNVPGYLLPLLPIAGIIFVSWLVARHLEPVTRELIKNLVAFNIRTIKQQKIN